MRPARRCIRLIQVVCAGEEWSVGDVGVHDPVRLVWVACTGDGVGSWAAVVFGACRMKSHRAHLQYAKSS